MIINIHKKNVILKHERHKTMKIEKWETEKTEYLINRPWLTARRDTVRLPNGKINPEFYILEYPDWVNVIAITKEGKFVMVEQYRHGLQNIYKELVAGVIEEGEEPLEAAKRELAEEAGYGKGDWELLSVISQNPSTTTNLTHCFLAKNVEVIGSQTLDDTEDIGIVLLSEDEVKEMLMSDEMKQALMAAPLWKYFYLKDRFKNK